MTAAAGTNNAWSVRKYFHFDTLKPRYPHIGQASSNGHIAAASITRCAFHRF